LAKLSAEGSDVYALADHADLAVKVYKETLRRSREEKVRAMVESRLADKTELVSFPFAIATDGSGAFAGFTNRSVLGAIGGGVIGGLKNLLSLLMLAVALFLLWIAVGLCFGILALLLIFIGKLVGPWLAVVLLFALYIALFLTVFTAMFGVMYHLWRDVCTTEIA
jgi:hypothetical protein